jgi:DNA replication and repair protein RecF
VRLEKIYLENFRNYKKSEVELNSDLVLILGENAAGKTNFLESIYFLSRLKSFRAPDNLLVKNQEDFFILRGQVGDNNFEGTVQINPSVRRQFKINDLKTKRSFWHSFTTVLFVPNDLNLFQLGPILRRKFLDETLSQVDQSYGMDLESLDHVLKQKSALLEQIYQNQAPLSDLDFWNEQLLPLALRITHKRQTFVDFLNEQLADKINKLTGFENRFEIKYKRMEAKDQNELIASLKAHESAEVRSGKNLAGPHRDDFEIYKEGQLNYLGQTKARPIILLDDVFSELDETRRTKLIENLTGHQIFISSTEEHHLPLLAKDAQILKVEGNTIK